MNRFVFSLSVMIVSVVSCTSSYQLDIAPEMGQPIFIDGVPFYVKTDSSVAVGCALRKQFISDADGDYLLCQLYIQNRSTSSFDFIPEQVSVIAFNDLGKNTFIPATKPEHFLKMIKDLQNFSLGLYAISAAVSSMNAGVTTSTTTFQTNSSTGIRSGSATTTTYDPAKAAIAQSTQNQQLQYMADRKQANYLAVEKGLLKRNTIFPDQSIEGIVAIRQNIEFTNKITVQLPIGPHTYRINFVPPLGQ